jgi:hypothetical protein
MDATESPSISSFVIRFVVDPGQESSYRGEIRHIQTQEEIHFDEWSEAVEFIKRYVHIEVESGK